MPVAEDAKGATIHVGEVEEIVEVVGAHGAEDGEELEGQVGSYLRSRAEEVAQGPGAGADHQPPAGAQVPREGPSLHVGEDLPGRGEMGVIVPALWPLNHDHGPTSLFRDFQVLWSAHVLLSKAAHHPSTAQPSPAAMESAGPSWSSYSAIFSPLFLN